LILEHSDRRVLGALRIADITTGLPVRENVQVRSNGVQITRNRTGDYVILNAPGFEQYTAEFMAPPLIPAVGSVLVEFLIEDPARRYLARRCTVPLPRDVNPANAETAASIFQPVVVSMYPSPAGTVAASWGLVRASVARVGTGAALSGALIRVLRSSDSALLATGLSDARGEALVGVPGIPKTLWQEGPGPVLSTELDVTIETFWDAAATGVPDPDDLEARRAALLSATTTAKLSSGRVLAVSLTI
jgi:hypothetical protein